jgi:uncharacterized protein YecE (DUF72 family)
VEVDSTFYGVPSRTTIRHWVESTPSTFRMALKVPRQATHEGPLAEGQAVLEQFLDVTRELGPRRGPILLQLPPRFTRSRLTELYRLLDRLPPTPGLAVEFRHRSCFVSAMFDELRTRGTGLVSSDRIGGLLLSGPDVVLRLLGRHGAAQDASTVTIDREADLAEWRQRMAALPSWVRTCWVYLANEYSGHAPATATRLGLDLGILEPPENPGRQSMLFGC